MTSLRPENFPHRYRPRQRRRTSQLRLNGQGGPQNTLTNSRIRRHLRARGLVGRISPAFVADYRQHMGQFALLSAVHESGRPLSEALSDPAIIAAAETKLLAAAEALHA